MTTIDPPRSPWLLRIATVVAIAAAILATRLGFGAFELQVAAVSLLVGVAIALLGFLVHMRAPSEAAGGLLVATSLAWTLGVAAARAPVAEIVAVEFLWVATVVHALDLPAGPRTDRVAAALVVAGYAVSFIPSPLAAAVVIATGIVVFERSPGIAPWRRARIVGFAALAAGLIVVPAIVEAVVGPGRVDMRLVTAATALVASLAVAVGAMLAADRPGRMVDQLVVAADPMTVIPAGESSVDDDIRAAVARATALTNANTMLQAELAEQVAAVEASRRRLIEAGDVERAALVARLESGLQARLGLLERAVRELTGSAAAQEPDVEPLRATLDEIGGARNDIRAIAEGLHPAALDGRSFASALAELVRSARIPVDVRLEPAAEPPTELRSVLWFVVSESLTNVTKHAGATRARVDLVDDGRTLRLEITDDGIGGARAEAGRGLAGLQDRVDAFGGTLTVDETAGGGTRVSAVFVTAVRGANDELSPPVPR
jgi:signal transduction histidine kinase